LPELKPGERRREESRERGDWCWMWGGCGTVILIVLVIAVEVRLLVDVNAAHLQWLTGDGGWGGTIRDVIELKWREDILWWRFLLDLKRRGMDIHLITTDETLEALATEAGFR
jgi:hypothetical protein